MRICSCWGFTAPMLVLAFPRLEDARELISILSRNSNEEELTNFYLEMCALERVSRFIDYRMTARIEDFTGDYWEDGSLRETPGDSEAFRVFLLQSLLRKVFAYERDGKCIALDDLESVVEAELSGWNAPVEEYAVVVNRILCRVRKNRATLPEAESWMMRCMKKSDWLSTEIVTEAMIDGHFVKLNGSVKNTLRYFIGRLPEIREMIDFLSVARYEERVVMGVPLPYLLKRKPESIHYMVLNEFERIKGVSNVSILNNAVSAVRKDIEILRDAYAEFVTDGSSDAKEEIGINDLPADEQKLFGELQEYGYSVMHLSSDERRCLADVSRRVDCMDVRGLLGIDAEDLDTFGEEMCQYGIYGINGRQGHLFREAIMNTVISVDKVYRSKEDIAAVGKIIERDVLPLLDTIMPVGVRLV